VERESGAERGQHIIPPEGKRLLWFLPFNNRPTFYKSCSFNQIIGANLIETAFFCLFDNLQAISPTFYNQL